MHLFDRNVNFLGGHGIVGGHIPLDRYYTPEEFRELRDIGLELGFRHVESSPLTRSSYHAWDQVQKAGFARA